MKLLFFNLSTRNKVTNLSTDYGGIYVLVYSFKDFDKQCTCTGVQNAKAAILKTVR